MSVVEIERLVIFALAGLLLGAVSLATLRLNTRLYLGGRLWQPIGLHLVRMAVLACALVWMAREGAGPLIAGAAGLVLARPLAMRMLGRTP